MKKTIILYVIWGGVFMASYAPASPNRVQLDSKWNYSLELRVTRCFKIKNVKIICDRDIVNGVVNAELQISTMDGNNKKFFYGYGKSIEGTLCHEHLARIQKLIKKQDQVCITGDGENTLDNGEVFARWQELETRLGKIVW